MRIRNRLAFYFTFIAGIVLLLYNYLIYLFLNDLPEERSTQNLEMFLGSGFLICSGLIFLLSKLAAPFLLRPIRIAIFKAGRIIKNNQPGHLKVTGKRDEISYLNCTFNRALEKMHSGNNMQSAFITNASHEIRNPLTAIIGETEVCLQKRRTPEEYEESLRSIAKEADRLEDLVKRLLDLSRVDFDESQLKREDCRVDEVVLETKQSLLRIFPDIQIVLDLPEKPDKKSLTIQGDKKLLKMGISNLLENGSKFSGKKTVKVSLTYDKKQIKLSVSDQGIGIPEAELKNILQPFYRARNARSFKGYGIGLSLTEKIIKLHKGEMNILSEEGQGTTVEVTFKQN